MKKIFVALCAALLLMNAAPASADYFYWEDPKTGASLTFPDTWKRVSIVQPDEIIRLAGPDVAGQPICRLRARADNRFTVYPVWLSDAIQQFAYSEEFWLDYVGEFSEVQMLKVQDNAGIGKAFASMAVATYLPPVPDAIGQRTAIMFAGVYFDTAYVFDCAAQAQAFKNWLPMFASIAKSVDLRKTHHELLTGDYRNFITNQHVRMKNPDGVTSTVY